MPQIKVEITIPDYEYQNWSDYQDGIDEVMRNVKSDISQRLRQEYIRFFEIQVTHEE